MLSNWLWGVTPDLRPSERQVVGKDLQLRLEALKVSPEQDGDGPSSGTERQMGQGLGVRKQGWAGVPWLRRTSSRSSVTW